MAFCHKSTRHGDPAISIRMMAEKHENLKVTGRITRENEINGGSASAFSIAVLLANIPRTCHEYQVKESRRT